MADEQVKTEAKAKKLSKMTLAEVEKELKGVQEKMGGLLSTHAQQLMKRKNALQKK